MKIEEYLEKIVEHLGLEGEIEIKIEESDERLRISLEVSEHDTALLIGARGDTLDALELLTKMSFKDDYPDKRIILDVNDYKLRQLERLKERSLDVGYKVLETGRPYEFRYLNSFERHIVHSSIAEEEGLSELETFSEDRDRGRVLTVQLKGEAVESSKEVATKEVDGVEDDQGLQE